ncbi:hypothetical protein S58_29130 [Bradyrhizobium oligotrophicum S58]|uniref:Uncharacterized protein n=1 Tax=Bradyrhizobium oligotrophicum S58 TaxID=1245469 RepID=M4Z6B5_9BRAD|nr:hypothetical protein S58_29130 [Bradyrhizobium oligotrophicum S58]
MQALAWNQMVQLHLQEGQAERFCHDKRLEDTRSLGLRQIKRLKTSAFGGGGGMSGAVGAISVARRFG